MKISTTKRKIGYTYGSVSGRYPFRGEKTIAFESKLEEDLLTVLEFSNAVVDVTEQPVTIEYTNPDGKRATYTPDFLVQFRFEGFGMDFTSLGAKILHPRPLLIEVKPREILRKKFRELKPKFRAALSYASENDMSFRIYDESRIRDTYFRNVTFLRRYRRYQYDPTEEERLLATVRLHGHCSIDVLLTSLYVTDEQRGLGLGHVYQLLATKKLACDLTLPLRTDTTVWLGSNY